MTSPLLTGPQAILCGLRALGCTYKQVRAGAARFYDLDVRSDEALESCFRKSALCLPWVPGCQGGSEPYLSQWEEQRLCAEIRHGADELASCPTDYILNYAHDQKIQRVKLAIQFLLNLNCPRLAAKLEFPSSPPTPSWLADFAHRNSLRIRCCEKLDSVRRKFCDRATIWNWFYQNSQVLQSYNSDLILNMDETIPAICLLISPLSISAFCSCSLSGIFCFLQVFRFHFLSISLRTLLLRLNSWLSFIFRPFESTRRETMCICSRSISLCLKTMKG